jgi:septal ring factor EnvC (AmiA/AmiB activator)
MRNRLATTLEMVIRTPRRAALALFLVAACFGGRSALAIEQPDVEATAVEVADPKGDAATTEAEDRKRAREAELAAVRRSIEVSERRQAALLEEIESLETDRASLTAELVATGKRLRATEEDIRRTEAEIGELHAREDRIRVSLRDRRAVMAEVLMALQRMGRTPPPAILSRPEDALSAIRGSILAGAVLPDIRTQAESLAADLAELGEVAARIEAKRDGLRARYASLGEEQARIDLLVKTKRDQRDQTEVALTSEQDKAAELAGQAGSLQSLIESLEGEVAAAARAAEDARRAAENTRPADQAEAARRLADTSRIAPAVHFADAKGLLNWPVSGEKILGFGESDPYGGKSQGLSLATRPGASVFAPADSWVVYAGPFRSYGQVLILNAGDDYHIVLAGMERIDATLGQFVLAGEPVATMGAMRLASLGDFNHTSAQPILYIEFRKNGDAIDSSPWWARATNGEVNG